MALQDMLNSDVKEISSGAMITPKPRTNAGRPRKDASEKMVCCTTNLKPETIEAIKGSGVPPSVFMRLAIEEKVQKITEDI